MLVRAATGRRKGGGPIHNMKTNALKDPDVKNLELRIECLFKV
jgi:hypothetical protein